METDREEPDPEESLPEKSGSEAEKRRHAAEQRRSDDRRKKQGIPRREDLARAMLSAVQAYFEKRSLTAAEQKIWTALIEGTLDRLDARGFDRKEAKWRLGRALDPRNIRP